MAIHNHSDLESELDSCESPGVGSGFGLSQTYHSEERLQVLLNGRRDKRFCAEIHTDNIEGDDYSDVSSSDSQFCSSRSVWYSGLDRLRDPIPQPPPNINQLPHQTSVAPSGNVVLVFTDIQGSTELWNFNPSSMRQALKLHNQILRDHIKQFGGYEVKTEGDAFMIAFPVLRDALKFCVRVQLVLMEVKWPAQLNYPGVCDVTDDGLWNGLRVRMGVHSGKAIVEVDPVTKRADYFGPTVNLAARIATRAQGGEIVISSDVHTGVMVMGPYDNELWDFMMTSVVVKSLGICSFKGFDSSHNRELFRVLPISLQGRLFNVRRPSLGICLEPRSPRPPNQLTWVMVRMDMKGRQWASIRAPIILSTVDSYNKCIMDSLIEFQGSHASKMGDINLLCFPTPEPAVRYCIQIQRKLLKVQWPNEILSITECLPIHLQHPEASEDDLVWKGPRVPMAITMGEAVEVSDGNYVGPTISNLFQLLANTCPGEISIARSIERMIRNPSCPLSQELTEFKVIIYPRSVPGSGLLESGLLERKKSFWTGTDDTLTEAGVHIPQESFTPAPPPAAKRKTRHATINVVMSPRPPKVGSPSVTSGLRSPVLPSLNNGRIRVTTDSVRSE